jgi:hypothetical protein
MPENGPSGSMSGEWKRSICHRATPRLHSYLSSGKKSSMDSTSSPINDANTGAADGTGLPVLPPRRPPLVPERSDFLEGDAPAADKVQAFLARALAATGSDASTTAGALVPRSTTQAY